MYAIEVENLHKSYGSFSILRNLSLRVSQGQVYGILGPPGAGKSTLIHMLMGFLRPGEGTIRVLGSRNLKAVHGRVGYLPEPFRCSTRYTAREYLVFLGRLSDMRGTTLQTRVEEELVRVGLGAVADHSLATFSRGMIQRVGIAQALLTDPDVLLMDEPTGGLDPAFRHELLDLLAAIRAQGYTMLLCTHHLDEIEYLCDRAGVLTGGRIAVEVDVHKVRGLGASVNIQVNHIPTELRKQLNQLSSAVQCGEYIVTLRPNSPTLQKTVLGMLLEADVDIVALESLERPLEHIYLEAVQHALSGIPQEVVAIPPDMPGHHVEVGVYRESDNDRDRKEKEIAEQDREKDNDTLLKELLQNANDTRQE